MENTEHNNRRQQQQREVREESRQQPGTSVRQATFIRTRILPSPQTRLQNPTNTQQNNANRRIEDATPQPEELEKARKRSNFLYR